MYIYSITLLVNVKNIYVLRLFCVTSDLNIHNITQHIKYYTHRTYKVYGFGMQMIIQITYSKLYKLVFFFNTSLMLHKI